MKNKIFKTLTEREKQVYNAITMGAKFKSADIAEFMGIKRNNVNTVLKNMYKKLDLPKEWRNPSGILWLHFNQEEEDELS